MTVPLFRRGTFRRLPLAVTAAVAAVALAACGSGSTPPADAAPSTSAPLHSMLPADLAAKGTLQVASNVEYPPFESYGPDNTTIVGVDRELADEFEKLLGVKLEFVNTSFDAIIPGLASKRYDMAMSAMSDTVERQQQVDFVDYLRAGGGIMLPKANPLGIKTLDDLCGLRIGINKGTTEVQNGEDQSAKCVAAGKQPLNTSIFAGQDQMVLALQSNRSDALLMDSTAGAYVAEQTKNVFTMLPPYEEGRFGIVFPKGSTQLQQAFQAALVQLQKDGTYQRILAEYGQDVGALTTFEINGTKK